MTTSFLCSTSLLAFPEAYQLLWHGFPAAHQGRSHYFSLNRPLHIVTSSGRSSIKSTIVHFRIVLYCYGNFLRYCLSCFGRATISLALPRGAIRSTIADHHRPRFQGGAFREIVSEHQMQAAKLVGIPLLCKFSRQGKNFSLSFGTCLSCYHVAVRGSNFLIWEGDT